MHARRRDLKKPLHVRFRRSATVHNAVLMDVGQELALSFSVDWFHKVSLLVDSSRLSFIFTTPDGSAHDYSLSLFQEFFDVTIKV
jgi:hypothetical protein